MTHDVFVSYSTKDKTIADSIVAAMENNNIRCWYAPRDIRPSDDWGDSITKGIEQCKVFILIFSGNTSQSQHVRDELSFAISCQAVILPFRVENLEPVGAMRLHLASRHWLDAFEPSWKAHIEQLIRAVSANLGKPEDEQPLVLPQPPKRKARPPSPPSRKALRVLPWVAGAAALAVAGWLGFSMLAKQSPQAPALPPAATSTPKQAQAVPTQDKNIIMVNSTQDSGPGTLRQALLAAMPGDTIRFDPQVFPPDNPATIWPVAVGDHVLPPITRGNITLDASDAGVILDGSRIAQEPVTGLEVYSSGNTIMGLQIIHFTQSGIAVCGGSNNIIGGDRGIGNGPQGQGNLLGFNHYGIDVCDKGAKNTITGNLVGTDVSGTVPMGNGTHGIWVEAGPSLTTIGPGNIIAFNGAVETGAPGVNIDSLFGGTKITANVIHSNSGPGIDYDIRDTSEGMRVEPPVLIHFNLEEGLASGHTCKGCTVEIFSTDSADGKVYEGQTTADDFGNFTLRKGSPLAGPLLTATTWSATTTTSWFSPATPPRSAVQQALDLIKDSEPFYQADFYDADLPISMNKAWLEGGKLIVQSEDEIGATAAISELGSARLAVAFDFSFAEAAGAGSHCVFEIQNSEEGASRRSTSVVFSANGAVELHHYVHPDGENYAEGRYDPKRVNAVKVVMLGEEVAVFLNDKLHFTAQDGSASPFSFQNLSAYNPIRCEIHNYRIWDLSGMAPGP